MSAFIFPNETVSKVLIWNTHITLFFNPLSLLIYTFDSYFVADSMRRVTFI